MPGLPPAACLCLLGPPQKRLNLTKTVRKVPVSLDLERVVSHHTVSNTKSRELRSL
jgi:hypothetical protein